MYAPEFERAIRWDDEELGISWPVDVGASVMSSRDAAAPLLRDIEHELT
jgi:dTDP-4-dehydrorhamnose 3,5-epimerase